MKYKNHRQPCLEIYFKLTCCEVVRFEMLKYFYRISCTFGAKLQLYG
jgi:hypothetical protein